MGAPGSGSTTLGHALAQRLGMAFADADDFYWKPTTPPFREKYDVADRVRALLAAMHETDACVVAGSVCGWSEELETAFDLVVFLSLPTELRMQRIEAREIARFGKADPDFLVWAGQYEEGRLPGRSRARHEAWLASRRCAVLRLDGDSSVAQRVAQVIDFMAI